MKLIFFPSLAEEEISLKCLESGNESEDRVILVEDRRRMRGKKRRKIRRRKRYEGRKYEKRRI